jgi:hypothetical protein
VNLVAELRRLGLNDAQIARSTFHGKPVAECEESKRRSDSWPGYRSKTEALYGMILEDEKLAGTIGRWEYEALTFALAATDNGKRGAKFTPDFCVWLPNEKLELREIKGGFIREAARVRFLVAKRLYPEFGWRMIQRKGGEWLDIL